MFIFPQLNSAQQVNIGLCPANERRCYKVTPSLIGWAQTWDQPCINDVAVSAGPGVWPGGGRSSEGVQQQDEGETISQALLQSGIQGREATSFGDFFSAKYPKFSVRD